MRRKSTDMPFAVDFVTFKVVDKKVAKRTAMQEQVLQPLRAYHQLLEVKANDNERGVFALEQFSLSQDKELQVTLYERGGGRFLFRLTKRTSCWRKRLINSN